MRIASIGFFVSDYPLALASALAASEDVELFLSRQNLAGRFPGVADLEGLLRERGLLAPNVRLHLVDYPAGQYHRKPGMAWRLLREVRAARPDVLHYQVASEPWVPFILPFLRRVPLVATIHDASHHSGDWPPDIAQAASLAIVTRLARQIIAHGREQAALLTARYGVPAERIHVIPFGGFPMLAPPEGAPARPVEPHTILFFGRLRAYKGVEVLIDAARLVAQYVPDLKVIIAGSGECAAARQAAAEQPGLFELDNRFIPVDETPALFQRAAVVALPYLDATQSGVIPVAYQAGRPVVASAVGSIPEVVDDGVTGFLTPPGDATAVAGAILRLLQDPDLRARMGQAAARKAATDLSWHGIAQRTLVAYRRALGEADHGARQLPA